MSLEPQGHNRVSRDSQFLIKLSHKLRNLCIVLNCIVELSLEIAGMVVALLQLQLCVSQKGLQITDLDAG